MNVLNIHLVTFNAHSITLPQVPIIGYDYKFYIVKIDLLI